MSKPRRFRLKITDPQERIPRLITAYGKVKGGEVALVLRPTEGRGILVHSDRKLGTKVWDSSVTMPGVATGRLLQDGASEVEVLDGPAAGRLLRPVRVPDGVAHGAEVPIRVVGDEALIGLGGFAGDVPQVPWQESDPRDVAKTLKAAQKGLPKVGDRTLKGRWAGVLEWGDVPRVVLRRKVTAYLWVTLEGSDVEGWCHSLAAKATWFGGPRSARTGGASHLGEATTTALEEAENHVAPLCTKRDQLRRRAVLDEQMLDLAQRLLAVRRPR